MRKNSEHIFTHTGFASPADDFLESGLSIDDYIIQSPSSTFMLRVMGNSMRNAGIITGDVIVVDRAIKWQNNHIVVAEIEGELSLRRFSKNASGCFLSTENFKSTCITKSDTCIWGVVVGVVRKL